MTTVYDIPADMLIRQVAEELKKKFADSAPPDWAAFAKTGGYTKRCPPRMTTGGTCVRRLFSGESTPTALSVSRGCVPLTAER